MLKCRTRLELGLGELLSAMSVNIFLLISETKWVTSKFRVNFKVQHLKIIIFQFKQILIDSYNTVCLLTFWHNVIGWIEQLNVEIDYKSCVIPRFTYKWLLYVRTPPGQPAIETFVSRVVFKLDPSYIPNDIVELTEVSNFTTYLFVNCYPNTCYRL